MSVQVLGGRRPERIRRWLPHTLWSVGGVSLMDWRQDYLPWFAAAHAGIVARAVPADQTVTEVA